MDMEEANSCPELQRARKWKLRTVVHPLLEVNSILTHDVIHNQSNWNIVHVVGKSFAYTVVHIDLPGNGDKSSPELGMPIYWTHLSPFWKSTTDVGTKKPWQQAVAPIPVTSRCALLEFACSIAL
jgi:hypothetical protein